MNYILLTSKNYHCCVINYFYVSCQPSNVQVLAIWAHFSLSSPRQDTWLNIRAYVLYFRCVYQHHDMYYCTVLWDTFLRSDAAMHGVTDGFLVRCVFLICRTNWNVYLLDLLHTICKNNAVNKCYNGNWYRRLAIYIQYARNWIGT